MRLVFVRHAEPDYERDSLTEKGWREAELLAERTARWRMDEIYCSPLGRARDTASVTLQKCGRTAQICSWLQEFDAPVIDLETGEKRIPWDFMPSYWTKIPEMYDIEAFAEAGVLKTGAVKAEYERVCEGIDGILAKHGYIREGSCYRAENSSDGTLVFFCHMGVTFFILSHLLHISPMSLIHGMFLAPSSVTVVSTEEREGKTAAFRTQMIGDTSHLYCAGEPASQMGYFSEIMDEKRKADR